jgi:hypothetical protein
MVGVQASDESSAFAASQPRAAALHDWREPSCDSSESADYTDDARSRTSGEFSMLQRARGMEREGTLSRAKAWIRSHSPAQQRPAAAADANPVEAHSPAMGRAEVVVDEANEHRDKSKSKRPSVKAKAKEWVRKASPLRRNNDKPPPPPPDDGDELWRPATAAELEAAAKAARAKALSREPTLNELVDAPVAKGRKVRCPVCPRGDVSARLTTADRRAP